MKKLILTLSLLLVPSIGWTQAALNPNIPALSLDANAGAAVLTGTPYAIAGQMNIITWITSWSAAPTSHTTQLQLSNDNVVWAVGDTSTNINGESRTIITAARFVRAVMTAKSGAVSITVSIIGKTGSIGQVQSEPTLPLSANRFLARIGTAAAPSFSYTSATTTGNYFVPTAQMTTVAGVTALAVSNNLINGMALRATTPFTWSSNDPAFQSSDLSLFRDATDTLAQRRGTNPQIFRVYNTYTDASNYERVDHGWASNLFSIVSNSAGSGTNRSMQIGTNGAAELYFRTNNANKWQVSNIGHYLAVTDNTYDIGASGATRPRTIHVGTSVISPAYTVGATPGVSGTCSSVTVVNGIVTGCTP